MIRDAIKAIISLVYMRISKNNNKLFIITLNNEPGKNLQPIWHVWTAALVFPKCGRDVIKELQDLGGNGCRQRSKNKIAIIAKIYLTKTRW